MDRADQEHVRQPEKDAPNNLPIPLNSFVGRDREIAEVVQLLESGRLVTITGLPGAGKSRLAIEAGHALAARFEHGVRYANVAPCVAEAPTQEVVTVALGVATTGAAVAPLPGGAVARTTLDGILDYLRGREMLLILDGAEHAAAGVAHIVTTILHEAPLVRVLVTSRISLAIPGELIWHLPLLEVPEAGDTPAEIRQREAVRLFMDRARAVGAGFELDDDLAGHVARICTRLEGNPLAVEMAAARVGTLGVGQIARRLEQSLDLLASSRRTGDDPHATLLGAIEWGYDLLSRSEQMLFERLSVFRGDFSLAAAEAVGGGDDTISQGAVVDLVASLVDKSMVAAGANAAERWYRLGAALQEYAARRLADAGLTDELRKRHAAFYRDFVVGHADSIRRRINPEVLDELERMMPDIMAAIDHVSEAGDATAAHEFVGGLYFFWFSRRHEYALQVVARVLAMDGPVPPLVRAQALIGAGLLTGASGAIDDGIALIRNGLEIAESHDEAVLAAEARLYLGYGLQQAGDTERAVDTLRTARAGFAAAEETWGVAWSEWFLGVAAMMDGDLVSAEPMFRSSLEIFRHTRSSYGIANALSMLGSVRRLQSDYEEAARDHRESLDILTELSDRQGMAAANASLGLALQDAGDAHGAAHHLERAVGLATTLGNGPWLAELHQLHGGALFAAGDEEAAAAAFGRSLRTATTADDPQSQAAAKRSLLGLAWWAWDAGHLERAVVLFSAVESLDEIDAPPVLATRPADPAAALLDAQARLGTQVYESVRRSGSSMTLSDAVAYALEPVGEVAASSRRQTLSLEDVELGKRVSAELAEIGERREVRVAGMRVAGRRRRPSGEKEPLPRDLRASGRFWLLMGLGTVVIWVSLYAFPGTRQWWDARDLSVNLWFADRRTAWLTDLADFVHALGSAWFFRPVRWGMLIALAFFKRWRHFFAAILAFATVEISVEALANSIGRPRPFVEVLAPWAGYSHPAAPVASLSVTLAVVGLALIPRGRWRKYWMIAGGAVMALLIIARTYLGVDHLSDGVVGAIFGAAVAVVVFRLLVPETVFPVVYRRGRTAHLDVSGARGRAITKAVADQLGIAVTNIELFGAEGSGGSTPLRLTAAGDPDTYLFAKLYSTSHLRADRWYKVGRTILYGALEDEVRFSSVRRLVEYEDYMLLRMKQAGVPSAEPYGFVEITPEREYLIVTEFLQDAQEITDAVVDDAVIDDGLLMIRRLWDAGLAHRDIKPANVLVRDGQIRLIDVAFATIRPSPWRQAVDLANMMMILALRTDAERVYGRALQFFAPDDIAEAFAATRSVTIPSQSRAQLKEVRREGSDVIEEFRRLSPPRETIAIQRWSTRRIALTIGAAIAAAMLLSIFIDNLATGALV